MGLKTKKKLLLRDITAKGEYFNVKIQPGNGSVLKGKALEHVSKVIFGDIFLQDLRGYGIEN